MENNATEPGSRVTRSLRKRLESVESDSTSRPGTPISSKLPLASDICSSPKLIRMTRRNSTCSTATPTKTPAKRAVIALSIAENLDTVTPTRTRTRRRSNSAVENEESLARTKIQKFPALDEEVSQNTLKSTIVTRSQSKSPQQSIALNISSPKKIASESKEIEVENIKTDILKKRKVGPKSKTRMHEDSDDVSDVEISVFENESEDSESISSTIQMLILTTDEEHSQGSFKNKEEESEENKEKVDMNISSHSSSVVEKGILNVNDLQIEKINLNAEEKNPSAAIEKEKDTEPSSTLSESKEITNLQDQIVHIVDNNIENKIINAQNSNLQENENINLSVSENLSFEDSNNSKLKNGITTQVTEEKIFPPEDFENVSDDSINKCPTPNAKPLHSENVDILSTSTLNRSVCKLVSKKVDFVSSPTNDSTIKNIYPKTPVSWKKANSFKENLSPCCDVSHSSIENYLDNCQNVMYKCADNEPEERNESTKSDIIVVFTPQRNLEMGQISIDREALEKKDLFPAEEAKINKSVNELDTSLHERIKDYKETEISTNISEKSTDDISSINQDFPIENSTTADGSNSDINQSNTSNDKCEAPKQLEKDQLRSITLLPENEELGHPDEDICNKENVLQKLNLHEKLDENENCKISSCIMSGNDKSSEDELKWTNPNVKGTTAEGTKIDSVVAQNNSSNKNVCDADNITTPTKKDREECTTPQSEYQDEEEEVEAKSDGEGESDKFKHDLLDNEAMEVNDYESGDSLDSEERREIEENEIPVDGESIGNDTTDVTDDDEEEGTENDSFIVSDSEDLRYHESDDEAEELAEDVNNENRKENKKVYKRLQCLSESSSVSAFSSTDEGVEEGERLECYKDCKRHGCEAVQRHNQNLNKTANELNNLQAKSNESIILNSSKLSDSVLRLYSSYKDEDVEENNAEEINTASQQFLPQLDQFNKSIRDLNSEVDTPTLENSETEMKQTINEENETNRTSTSSPDETADRTINIENMQSDSDFGEKSATFESEVDKENEHKSSLVIQDRKLENGLSISVHNYREEIAKEGRQRSFTIDVTVKDGEIETGIKLNKSVSTSSSSTDSQENEHENEKIKHFETRRQIPFRFSNPLIRTRRQSLVLPANPDSQICADGGGIAPKVNRKSLGILSNNDFKPSQSFIDTIELQKSEGNPVIPKRKRLSKSFCGASETHDNSIIDIDVRHLHKRSKLICENSTEESQESMEDNIISSKHSTDISSTPYEKINKNDSYSHQRILARCDEILEAANRAKLESKIRNRKNNTKPSKKQAKKKSVLVPSGDINIEDNLRKISKEIKRKDKTKTALSQAIKAADVILSKKKRPYQNKKEQEEPDSKELPAEMEEAIGNPVSKKQFKRELIHKQGKIKDVPTTSTSAGSVMELPKSPERKMKKSTYIQLSTGKVSIEPITPKKRLVKAFNGAEFRESPATPCAVGFKVRKIAPLDNKASSSSILKAGKRKRYDGSFKNYNTSKAHWTQSGFFKEEQISKSRGCVSEKTNHRLVDDRNFKEKSLMRRDIQRSNKREILLLKQRRQI